MAKKKTVAAPRLAAAPSSRRLEVAIDYPRDGEGVRPGSYTIRLTAVGASQAQVRVGDGEWVDCRESVGHFWHDWAPQAGPAALAARARAGKGRWVLSPGRDCVVA